MATSIKALSKKNQAAINKAYKYYRAYHRLVNLNDAFETDKEISDNEKSQAIQYDKYDQVFSELPKGEQLNFNRQHKAIHGYD